MFLGHTDTGKSQPLDSKILTPHGWVKMGDIKLGDEIFGKNGEKQYVIGIYPQGKRPVYQVTTSDNGVTYCDVEHLWDVNPYKDKYKREKNNKKRYFSDNTFKTLTLSKILSKGVKDKSGRKNFKIPVIDPINYDGNILPIDPYVLGCILGDGHIGKNGHIVTITTKDDEIIQTISETPHFRRVNTYREKLALLQGLSNLLQLQMKRKKNYLS